jgi:hypothetical protein
MVGVAFPAAAFYPFGGFNANLQSTELIWAFHLIDTNEDGDVTEGEGLRYWIESGEFGFDTAEREIVQDAFEVWEDVPSSYMAWRFVGPTAEAIQPNPVLGGTEGSAGDFLNTVFMDVGGDEPFGGIVTGFLGVALMTGTIDTIVLEINENTSVQFPGPQLIETDIVIDAFSHRPTEDDPEPEADLLGTMVHEVGHTLGLGHVPTHNFKEISDETGFIEDPVYAQRLPDGSLELVGVTSTMFPFLFETEVETGILEDGARNLSPMDISAITRLYPRADTDNFFDMTQEVRTLTRPDLPSQPIPGAHIIAWCDVDNNPITPRVPVFSSMSGLYEYDFALSGRFWMRGLLKKMETLDGELFNATYTFTSQPIPGDDNTGGQTSIEFDSMNQGFNPRERNFEMPAGLGSSQAQIASEVFRREGNLLDAPNNFGRGTVMVYDEVRRKLVALDPPQDTLAQILPGTSTMFGDDSDLCPTNVVLGIRPMNTPTALRGLRDSVLLNSAVGVLMVETYYRMAPAVSQYLLAHTFAFRGAEIMFAIVEWSIAHTLWLTLVPVVLMLGFALYRSRRNAKLLTMIGLVVAVAVSSGSADALLRVSTPQDLAQGADQVISGTVLSTNGVNSSATGLGTVVTVQVDDVLKGRLNKNSTVQFKLPTGQVGALARFSPALPNFRVGEEVVLYLVTVRPGVLTVYSGTQGKLPVLKDANGQKYVRGDGAVVSGVLALKNEGVEPSADSEAEAKDGEDHAHPAQTSSALVPLEDYEDYVRSIVKAQKKAEDEEGDE